MAKKKTTDGKAPMTQDEQDIAFFLVRKTQLFDARKGQKWNVEGIWRQADNDYVPHRLGGPKKKVLVENERTEVSTYVNLSKDEWRSKEAKNDPYIKIQTAMALLFGNNPEATFDPASKKYEANTKLFEQLYHRSWTNTAVGSKKELRKFIFNLGKYGWSPARRYYKRVVRKDMQEITKYNLQTQEFEYQNKDMVDVDDVYFESKSPWDCWIDDMAKPDDPRRRDWMWREVYDKTGFEALLKSVKSKAKVDDFQFSTVIPEPEKTSQGGTNGGNQNNQFTSTDLITVYFYENRVKDKFILEADGKLIKSMPLPRVDKELSLVDTYWTMRDDQCPYGIGINEAMRSNKVLLDKIRNMTVDQVVLSIYKMFFFQGSEQLDDEGGENISIEPGKGKKVVDPKNISWLEVPGPGKDSYTAISMLEQDMEDDTGITKTLSGEVTGKTLGEVALAKEGALKRLGTPLLNIKAALEWDAKLCVNLMKLVYSIPRVFSTIDPELIAQYVTEVNDDKELYFVDPATGVFNSLQYREFQLGLEKTDAGFNPTEDKQFFMVRPSWMDWEGEITIKVESMVEMSKPLERQTKLEMSNLLIPVIGQMASAPQLLQAYLPSVKMIIKLYDEDPKKWLPIEWLMPQQMGMGMPGMPGMAVPGQQDPMAAQPESMQAAGGVQPPAPQTVLPSSSMGSASMPGLSQKLSPPLNVK